VTIGTDAASIVGFGASVIVLLTAVAVAMVLVAIIGTSILLDGTCWGVPRRLLGSGIATAAGVL
jgi:hypothetical protein